MENLRKARERSKVTDQQFKRQLNPNVDMRRCLGGCGRMFKSEGPWNRICADCAGSAERTGAALRLHKDPSLGNFRCDRE